jgi:hypothetical protein
MQDILNSLPLIEEEKMSDNKIISTFEKIKPL